ncbi:MAG: aspartate dehydrogenase, partial [Pseudomonadota bacterium]
MSRIAIIGHGAVARYLSRAMEPGSVAAVIARPGRATAARAAIATDHVVHSAADLPLDPDCVVDCAGHAGLRVHGAAILSAGIDLITVSIGALADDGLWRDLEAAAKAGDSRLHLASGAIGALDALSAASVGALDEVRYTGRKPPESWRGSPAEKVIDLGDLKEATIHFDGTARDCA